MDDFNLFNLIDLEYRKATPESFASSICSHSSIIFNEGITECTECGEQLKTALFDIKNTDPSRLQPRKLDEKSIYKDVEGFGLNHRILSEANRIYIEVSNNQIYRGNSRKAIIFACIYNACKLFNIAKGQDELLSLFSISKNKGMHGIKHVNSFYAKRGDKRTTIITVDCLLSELMSKFKYNERQKANVIKLYTTIKSRSSKFNRSRATSISAGLLYFWMKKRGDNIVLKQYSEQTGVSELTIINVAKEIARIIGVEL